MGAVAYCQPLRASSHSGSAPRPGFHAKRQPSRHQGYSCLHIAYSGMSAVGIGYVST